MSDLSTPQAVQSRLEDIDRALALLQNEIEQAAMEWFREKRDRDKKEAQAFLTAKGTDTARRMIARDEAATVGAEEEGRWEGLKALLKTLESRSVVGTASLKAQGRS
jgi:hypothetical protein